MKLIVILLTLLALHYMSSAKAWLRWAWFDRYMQAGDAYLQKTALKNEIRFALLLLLPVIVISFLLYLLNHHVGHFFYFIASFFILWYCWGTAIMLHDAIQMISADTRKQTRFLLTHVLVRNFSLVFWFVILGPVGAILYLLIMLAENSQYAETAAVWRDWLDWPAARVLSLGYALAGHFVPAFSYWCNHVLTDVRYSQVLLEETGLLALYGHTLTENTDESENEQAQALINRAQIMLLIVLAIFTLGAWIY